MQCKWCKLFFSNNCACIPLAYESSKCEKTFFLQLHYVMFLTLGHQSNGGEKDWQLETPALMDVIANTAIVCKTSLQQHGYHFQDSICCPLEIGTYYPYQKSRLMTSLKTAFLKQKKEKRRTLGVWWPKTYTEPYRLRYPGGKNVGFAAFHALTL